jgi:hypothetical protein
MSIMTRRDMYIGQDFITGANYIDKELHCFHAIINLNRLTTSEMSTWG